MTKEEARTIIKRNMCKDCNIYLRGDDDCDSSCYILDAIRSLEKREIGKWIFKEDIYSPWSDYYCSNCFYALTHDMVSPPYCPICGAKMEGKE